MNTVWVDLLKSLFKSCIEELTTSRLLVMSTSISPVRYSLRINKIMVNKILNSAFEELISSKIDNSVSNEQSIKLNP
jgi:hypothetical protein